MGSFGCLDLYTYQEIKHLRFMKAHNRIFDLFKNSPILFAILISISQAQTISIHDTVIASINPEFYGIQYHNHTYNDPHALAKLRPLQIKSVRLWAKLNDFHPQPEVWQWDALDAKINEVVAAGFEPTVCLYQSEQWFTGNADAPWWNDSTAVSEWQKAAFRLADRYKDVVHRYIIFDEINMMHPEDGYYISFRESAQLYCKAAAQIKKADALLQCGGPSSFGGWENGHWAEYVLKEPDGSRLLDFISSNLFLSWNSDDPDSLIMNRTIWYEEAPMKIKSTLGNQTPATLMLDAYNVSALWQKDGELWTDPRNTNFFGGVYQAAALMHAAKGGFSIALHWETLGGYGILDWYSQFNPLPPYFAWRFMVEIAGLKAGSQIIGCTTDETPKLNVQHHGGMNVNAYNVQPFAIRQGDSCISVVLINKYQQSDRVLRVAVPDTVPFYSVYRFDARHVETCFTSVSQGKAGSFLEINCPARSVTVVKFFRNQPVEIPLSGGNQPEKFKISAVFPNPFNGAVHIDFRINKSGPVQIDVFSSTGQKVGTILHNYLRSGRHSIIWHPDKNGKQRLASGIYYLRFRQGREAELCKVLYLK